MLVFLYTSQSNRPYFLKYYVMTEELMTIKVEYKMAIQIIWLCTGSAKLSRIMAKKCGK